MPKQSYPELVTYGCDKKFPHQIDYDRFAFARRLSIDKGVPRRPKLFRSIATTLFKDHFEWHTWTDRVINTLCDVPDETTNKAVRLAAFPGCSNSAKTFNIVSFASVWWLCDPEDSSVTLVSTTVKSLRRRGWAEVQAAYDDLARWRIGNFVDSRMLWQVRLGDDKHAIIGRAVEEGATHKVADDIKGVHTRRQMVIIDEATAVPEAIYEACANLYSYPEEFILVCIGNPRNRLDAFGRFCEPDKGWLSVTVDTGEWEAKPMMTCGATKPQVITFDAELSPNIVEGKIVSRHLPTKESVNAAKRAGGGQTPHFWQNFRGFWPPEGLVKTVFTESALITFGGYDKHVFTGENFHIIGAFDPAYGGDRPALRFAKLGEVKGPDGPIWGIELFPPIIIPLNAASTNPAHYQLAEGVRRQCEKVTVGQIDMSCRPENLAVDDTGEGGFADVVYRLWSQRVIRIEFGGAASTEPCSLEDMRPANEVYKNKRVEMFFRARDALNSGQLKGMDVETAIELCSIEFDDVGKIRTVLMSKDDYRKKFGKSPDLADTCFTEGTLILTEHGQQAIETITVGDKVMTPFGLSPVVAVHTSTTNRVSKVYFSNGRCLEGTPNHKVFTWDKGWTRMDYLSLTNTVESDSNLWSWQLLNLFFTKGKGIGFKALVDTFRLTTEIKQSDFYTELFGPNIEDRFRKACAFIIRTVTGVTTALRTWKSYLIDNIVVCTCANGSSIQRTKNATENRFYEQHKRQVIGIEVQKEDNGIPKTENNPGKTDLSPPINAVSAEKHSLITRVIQGPSVQTPVGKEALETDSKKSAFALFAVVLTKLINILRRKVVPVHVQTVSVPERLVFNLTLRDHNAYYANGILVANCAMLMEVARLKGFRLAPLGETAKAYEEEDKTFTANQALYNPDSLYGQEEPPEVEAVW